jgi:hypothetical protein
MSDIHEEFKQQNGRASRCFAIASDLYMQGQRDEAKKIESEGDLAFKRAKQLFKEMKAGKK